MDYIKSLTSKRVVIITNDGKNFVGTLIGMDHWTNIVVQDCVERVFNK